MEVIPRVVVKEFKYSVVEKVPYKAGLDSFIHTHPKGEHTHIELYKLVFRGLVVQEANSSNLLLLEPGTRIKVKCHPWKTYCKWHNGPLDREDNPLSRVYCIKPVTRKGLGYCKLHENSTRALYDRCLSSVGERNISKCIELDRILCGKVNFVVYIVDYGGLKAKIGVTREFRFLHRISEQPHIVAKIIYKTKSAYEARSIEILLSRKLSYILTEKPSTKKLIHQIVDSNLKLAVTRVRSVIENIVKLHTINIYKDTPMVRVTLDHTGVLREITKVYSGREGIPDETMELIGYWGGFLILNSRGSVKAIKASTLLHNLSIMVKD